MPGLFTKFEDTGRLCYAAVRACFRIPRTAELLRPRAAYPERLSHTVEIDAALQLAELNEAAAMSVLSLAPFGHGNPSPLFAVMNVEIAGPPAIREKFVRIPIRQDGRTLFLKSWNGADRWQQLTLARVSTWPSASKKIRTQRVAAIPAGARSRKTSPGLRLGCPPTTKRTQFCRGS